MTALRVIDFETTGMEPPAEVVEVGYCDLVQLPDGTWHVEEPYSWLCGVAAIPPEVRAVHHITIDEVAGLAPFDRAALFATGDRIPAAIVAHNLDFETKFLGEHGLPAICTLKAALRVWPAAPAHSNGVLRYWLEDQGLLSLEHATAMPPHRAGPDAYVTAHILKALFAAGATGKEMVAWTKEPRLLPTCPIGKFRGKPWAEVEGGFLSWMLNQATMESDLVWNARRELERRAGR
jgi:exodeoxyribonuclease X